MESPEPRRHQIWLPALWVFGCWLVFTYSDLYDHAVIVNVDPGTLQRVTWWLAEDTAVRLFNTANVAFIGALVLGPRHGRVIRAAKLTALGIASMLLAAAWIVVRFVRSWQDVT